MKQIHLLIALLVLVLLGLIFFHPEKVTVNTKQNPSKQLKFTPEELMAREKAKKRRKRAAGYAKQDAPDKYALFHHRIRTRANDSAPAYPGNYKLTELRKAIQNHPFKNARKKDLGWVPRGPANVAGRTRGLILWPEDPQNTWYAGSVAGGVWKTTDKGESWRLLTPDFPNLATSTIAICQSQPEVMYVGTGEGFYNLDAINGTGMFKSTDAGETWNQLPLDENVVEEEYLNINRIIVDPDDPDVVLFCSNTGRRDNFSTGIYRSTNGGQSWGQVFTANNRIQQIIYNPENFNIQYASVYALGVVKSTDGGKTWKSASAGLQSTGRIELAIANVDTEILYASVEGERSDTGSDLYISRNGGDSWSLVTEANGPAYDWLGGQGWYNNTITVHPYRDDVVYVGGINLWKMDILDLQQPAAAIPVAVDTFNTASFIEFVNFGGLFLNGGFTTGEDWFNRYESYPVDVSAEDYTSIEIRFGPGRSQLAHRFVVPEGAQAGVPPSNHFYADFIEVPFEVWDVTNNQQLMVSFRDQENDGIFDLEPSSVGNDIQPREYIYVHAIPYDNEPSPEVAQTAGIGYKTIYATWPVLRPGSIWSPNSLPESFIKVYTANPELRETTNITDVYNEIDGKNSTVHVDHHNVQPVKVNENAETFFLVTANDGGLYYSDTEVDPGIPEGSWSFAGQGYVTGQFYGVAKRPGEEEYIGGLQDHGTWRSPKTVDARLETNYIFQVGGDGFDALWNTADPNLLITSSQFNFISRSDDFGQTWQVSINGLDDVDSEDAPFITKVVNSKNNPEVLFTVGKSGVWRSDNFGESWNSVPITEGWTLAPFIDIKVSKSNNSIVWAGTAMNSSLTLHVSTDGGQTFEQVNNYERTAMGAISGIETHPLQDSTAYALFSFADAPKILRTTDLGESWEDITGFLNRDESSRGFPDVATYSLFVFPNEPSRLWAGTEIGIVESTNNGQSWQLLQSELPNTAVWDMKLINDQLVVGTHGRGIWTLDLPVSSEIILTPSITGIGVNPKGELAASVELRSAYDSVQLFVNEVLAGTEQFSQTGEVIFTLDGLTPGQDYEIFLKSFVDKKPYRSNTRSTFLFEVDQVVNQYQNDFNQSSGEDFIGSFSVKQPVDFNSAAIHSPHPYARNTNYIYLLKHPVKINSSMSNFSYRDIAIVEPGERGTVFGDDEFWDYVIVEGTTDGITWRSVTEGYDSRRDSEWLRAYENETGGAPNLYEGQNFNLMETFAHEDTVLLRFRLFSDPESIGWGWAIDDLTIQTETTVGIDDRGENEMKISSHPNPAKGAPNFNFSLPSPGNTKIEVWNITGQQVWQKNLGYLRTGTHQAIWQATANKGVYLVHLISEGKKASTKVIIE